MTTQPTDRRAKLLLEMQCIERLTGKPVTRAAFRTHSTIPEKEWIAEFGPVWGNFKGAYTDACHSANPQQTQEVVDEGDRRTINLDRTTIKTLEELVKAFEIDLETWRVDRFVANKWDAPNGEPLYQVKAHLARKNEAIAAKDEIAELKKLALNQASPAPWPASVPPVSGNVLELAIMDHHFGKLAWGVETGHDHYDTKIAQRIWEQAYEHLVHAAASAYKIEKVLLLVGNDILNSDDSDGRTTHGTYVATDGRYHKTFSLVRNTLINTVQRLRQLAPVHVVVMPGNHDRLSAWHLGDSLECFFHQYPDIVVDNLPRARKYFRWGSVLLGFTHGDKGKRTDYPLLMATEQPEAFGATTFREWHTGHNHRTQVDEYHGVRVRILPALCAPDAWHNEEGFVGAQRTAQAFVWNKNKGLLAQFYYNQDAEKGEGDCKLSSLESQEKPGTAKIPVLLPYCPPPMELVSQPSVMPLRMHSNVNC